MIAVLTRIFGFERLALAEDVAQDAFCRAVETWKIRGAPANPSAWLMTAAKRRAIDVLRRERTASDFAPQLASALASEWTLVPTVTELFGAGAIEDDQLRMIFSCCAPALSETAQIMLVLNLVCGFSVAEIAGAFLSGQAAVEKRIARGKKALAAAKELFDFDDAAFAARLDAVHAALYLLFNEGYHGASPRDAVRVELCREAMRLGLLLSEHRLAATPATFALCALMWLQAARLPARTDASGELRSLLEQDRGLWDRALIERGLRFLDLSAQGDAITPYHVEAAIASVHARAATCEATDWSAIVTLYDRLMRLKPSPVVALNRAIAVGQAEGPARGLEAIRAIAGRDRLERYPFYFAALADLEQRAGDDAGAARDFTRAAELARNPMERRFLTRRSAECSADPTGV